MPFADWVGASCGEVLSRVNYSCRQIWLTRDTAGQRRGHQGHNLVSCVRPPRRISEVNVTVDEFTKTQVLGEGDRKRRPSIGHQAVVIEGDLHAVGVLQW